MRGETAVPQSALPGLGLWDGVVSRGLRPLRGLRTPVNLGHEPPALRWMADKAVGGRRCGERWRADDMAWGLVKLNKRTGEQEVVSERQDGDKRC